MAATCFSRFFLQRQHVRFRRYSRGGWAVFRSLSLEVEIGTLASYIADRQLRKSHISVRQWIVEMSTIWQSDDDGDALNGMPQAVIAEQLLPVVLPVRCDGVATYPCPFFELLSCRPVSNGATFLFQIAI